MDAMEEHRHVPDDETWRKIDKQELRSILADAVRNTPRAPEE